MDGSVGITDGSGQLAQFLISDHRRLDGLLSRAVSRPYLIDDDAFAEFRRGLLRHIVIEENILLPAAERARDGVPLLAAARLRLDHGALAALLVPTPTPAVVRALRAILAAHHSVEEGPDGFYAQCECLVAHEVDALLRAAHAVPAVSVAAHVDGPPVVAATRRALLRAGYALEVYETYDR